MHRKCPRWSASCARTRPAHPGSGYKVLHSRVERLPQMPPHSKCCQPCVSLIHRSCSQPRRAVAPTFQSRCGSEEGCLKAPFS
jgi:hypothetical protein